MCLDLDGLLWQDLVLKVVDPEGLATLFRILNKSADCLLGIVCVLIGRYLLHRHDFMFGGLVKEGVSGQLLGLSGSVKC